MDKRELGAELLELAAERAFGGAADGASPSR